jgi:chemotaxis protein methyltransferase CheR
MIREELFIGISSRITELLGIHFPENRWNDLERGLTAAARELHIDDNFEAIGKWLSESNRSVKDLMVISSHLTIGETYFFREKNALDFFKNVIIPGLIQERERTNREIRLWSAGCSSGEEPYSLAILLSELIPDINRWNLSILATDINPAALRKAAEGVYSQWSFRETAEATLRKYFTPRGKNWEIVPEIKNMVSFSVLNLADPDFPLNTNQTDVIFCRNVLMYFTPEKATEVGTRFFYALNDKGWLITSQVELNDDYFSLLSRKSFDNGIYYQKVPKVATFLREKSNTPKEHLRIRNEVRPVKKNTLFPESAGQINKVAPPIKAVPVSPALLFSRGEYLLCAEECHRLITHGSNDAKIFELLVRANANAGKLSEARIYVEKLIELDSGCAGNYYLYATILLELNNLQEAEPVLKKALYLEPDHLFANLTMGRVLKKIGKANLSAKYLKQAGLLLDRFMDDDLVPASDGMTAGRIREMIKLS